MDRIDESELREVTRRLFTVAASRIEAMASAAGEGEASDLAGERAAGLANDLAVAAGELITLADAIVLLAERF